MKNYLKGIGGLEEIWHLTDLGKSKSREIGVLMDSVKKYYVTKPELPRLDSYTKYLARIWDSGILTNNGSLLREFEDKLALGLKVDDPIVTANATLGLMSVMKTMKLEGEVITTPFTFVATSNAILWSGLQPVFVDVTEGGVNICPKAVEAAITEKTSAILAVHCYGIPCDHASLREIADRYGIKLIYDACHSFATEVDGVSILEWGDASVVSLHATKMINAAEGGIVIAQNQHLRDNIRLGINFGIESEYDATLVGLNGKMSEFHAALGLANLENFPSILAKRKHIFLRYKELLSECDDLEVIERGDVTQDGFAYLPTLIKKTRALDLDSIKSKLEVNQIFARRYFYPLVTDLSAYKDESVYTKHPTEHARELSRRILCLPIYPSMTDHDIEFIVEKIIEAVHED